MGPVASALIGVDQAAFVCGGVGMSAATCRPGALPNIARATGCRVSADRRTVTILLAAAPGAALLDDVRRTGAIAVVFTQPSTHRTLQFKGADARIVPLEAGDYDVIERYVRAFAADVTPLGFSEAYMRALLACPREDLVAVQFTIAAAFSQTPGPRAGEPLGNEVSGPVTKAPGPVKVDEAPGPVKVDEAPGPVQGNPPSGRMRGT